MREGTEKPGVRWLVKYRILNDQSDLVIDIGPTKHPSLRVVSHNLITNGSAYSAAQEEKKLRPPRSHIESSLDIPIVTPRNQKPTWLGLGVGKN
jgi:hypothetical protein